MLNARHNYAHLAIPMLPFQSTAHIRSNCNVSRTVYVCSSFLCVCISAAHVLHYQVHCQSQSHCCCFFAIFFSSVVATFYFFHLHTKNSITRQKSTLLCMKQYKNGLIVFCCWWWPDTDNEIANSREYSGSLRIYESMNQ